jgi:hypothetical protein
LHFVRRFPRYSPYNALLLHIQNPEVQYTATADQWRQRFARKVKPHARPLVILAPFGPVMFVYDVSDTEGQPLPADLFEPFYTIGNVNPDVYGRTRANCFRDRVVIQEGPLNLDCAGSVSWNASGLSVGRGNVRHAAKIVVQLNVTHTSTMKYVTLIHELAHLHCGHLGRDTDKWWPNRSNLTQEQREFEAESVGWLVARRQGLEPYSERYLSGYLNANPDRPIPDISLEHVMTVAGYLESFGQKRLQERKPNSKKTS